jgi:hypothetical protein
LGLFNESSLTGIFVNIRKDLGKMTHALDNPRREPFSPNMTCQPKPSVEPHGKYTQDPLHNSRQALAQCWLDNEMNMIPHDAEIFDTKRVSALGLLDDRQEQILLSGCFKDHFLAIGAGRHMIAGSFKEYSGLSHANVSPAMGLID